LVHIPFGFRRCTFSLTSLYITENLELITWIPNQTDLKWIAIDTSSLGPTLPQLSIYEHLLCNSTPENHLNLFGLSQFSDWIDTINVFPIFSQQRTVDRIKGASPSCVDLEDATSFSVYFATLSDHVFIHEVVESISQEFPQTENLTLFVRDPLIHIVRSVVY
jgi:hypothetical protein